MDTCHKETKALTRAGRRKFVTFNRVLHITAKVRMRKYAPFLRHTLFTSLIFVLVTSVLLGLLANYSADSDLGQHRTLTGRVLHLLWPMLLFSLYLPALLLFPLRRFEAAGIAAPHRRRRLFVQVFLLLSLANPVAILWVFSLVTHGSINWIQAAMTVGLLAVAAFIAIISGLRSYLFGRPNND